MGRPSLRAQRRTELITAFARVLARHGFAGATIAAVAAEAGVTPGLVHHYFTDKRELLLALVADLLARFRRRGRAYATDDLDAYIAAALALDGSADLIAARCWVGVFAEAVRDSALFDQLRRVLDTEITAIRRRSRLDDHSAAAVLAFIIGSLVFGAFAPRKTAGFAAPALRHFVKSLAP